MQDTPNLLPNNEIMMGIIRAAKELNVPLGSIRCMKSADDHAEELVQWKFKYDGEVGTMQHPIDMIPPDEEAWFRIVLDGMKRMIAQKPTQ